MKIALRIILAINTFALFPCAIATVSEELYFNPPTFLQFIMIPAFILVIFLRCFYLPYLFLGFTLVGYPIIFIRDKKKGKISIFDIIYFVLLTAICIIGMFSLEFRYAAVMTI